MYSADVCVVDLLPCAWSISETEGELGEYSSIFGQIVSCLELYPIVNKNRAQQQINRTFFIFEQD